MSDITLQALINLGFNVYEKDGKNWKCGLPLCGFTISVISDEVYNSWQNPKVFINRTSTKITSIAGIVSVWKQLTGVELGNS